MRATRSTVYMLHFVDADGKTARYKHAGHYIGSCPPGREQARWNEHRSGNGANLIRVILEAGLDFVVARTWDATRGYETQLKKRGGAKKLCPICQQEEKDGRS